MKLNPTQSLFTPLSAQQLQQLAQPVAETVSTQTLATGKTSFGAADLWHIQRNRKCIVNKRRVFA